VHTCFLSPLLWKRHQTTGRGVSWQLVNCSLLVGAS
jgi:hypothetical protein